MIPQPLRCKTDWHRPTMDLLLENDTWATVWLTQQKDSDTFLDFIYPEWLLLPKGKTLAGLLDTLNTQGNIRSSTKSRHPTHIWSGFPKAKKRKFTNHESEIANFFNEVRVAVHEACGVSCL
jgi:hypothetical protein